MKHILLTSNGFINISKRSKKMDKLFEEIAKDKKVLLIVNATKLGSNYVARKDVKDNFEKVGAKKVDIIEIDKDNVNTIFKYDILYGMGGDPTPLMDDMNTINFREYLLKFLETGIYIGESAGSMVLYDNLKWVWDVKKGTKPKYDILPISFNGLNIIDELVYPHYNEISEEQIKKIDLYEKENEIKFTRLSDGEFIWV